MRLPFRKRKSRKLVKQSARRLSGQRLRTELLEDRLVLASGSVFAEFLGRIDDANPIEHIPVAIAPEQVGLKSGALIGLHLEARGQSVLDPAVVKIRNQAGHLVNPLFQKADLAGGLGSVAVVGLAAGNYRIELAGDRGTVGSYKLNVFLAGDFDGNHRIDRADVTAYRSHYGARAGDARYDLTADVNLDGLISAYDFSLWQRNSALNLPATAATASRLASTEKSTVSSGPLIRPQLLSSFVAKAVETESAPTTTLLAAAESGDTPSGTVYDGVTAVLPTTGFNPTASTRFIEGRFAWGQQAMTLLNGPENNLIVNGGFESAVVNHPEGWDIFEEIPGWTLDATEPSNQTSYPKHFELQRGILGGPYEGAQHLELDADENGPNGSSIPGERGSIYVYQDVATVAGRLYSLSFAFGARPNAPSASDNVLALLVTNAADGFELLADTLSKPNTTASADWSTHSYAFVAIGSTTRIRFNDGASPSRNNTLGTFLDDVVLLAGSPDADKNADRDSTGSGKHSVGGRHAHADTVNGGLHQEASANPCVACSSGNMPSHLSEANPHPIIELTLRLPSDMPLPTRLEATLTFGGLTGPTVYYDTTGLTPGEDVRIALVADATALATGRFDWDAQVRAVRSAGVTTVHSFSGQHTIFNDIESEFGNRMWVENLDQLRIYDDGVLLVRGDRTAGWFPKTSGGDYQTPAGSFSTLVKHGGGTYTLTLKDGREDNFSATGLLTSRLAANGEATTYAYTDADGDAVSNELSSITDPFGRALTYAYAGGLLSTVTDFAGRVTTYEHDINGRVETIAHPDPDGGGAESAPVHRYTYYTSGLIESATAPGNIATTYEYDAANRLREVTTDGETWLLEAARAQGVVDLTVSGYDASHLASSSYLTAESEAVYTDENGNETRYRHDAYGYLAEMTDALGKIWTYDRDANGMVTRMLEPDPDGAGPLGTLETNYTYDAKGNLTLVEVADGTEESWTYDATFGRMTSHTDGEGRQTLWTIDAATGDVLSMTQVVGTIGGSDDVVTEFTYTDGTSTLPKGLLLSVTDPLGRVTEYDYETDDAQSDFGWLVGVTYAVGTADEASVAFEYDAFGNVTAFEDELNRRTEYEYNALDRLTKMILEDPDGAGSQTSPEYLYDYCSCGMMNDVTDPLGNNVHYTFDKHHRVTKSTLPDPDGASPFNRPEWNYAYDGVGNLTSAADALGRTTSYEYDALNRLVSRTDPDPDGAGSLAAPEWTYTYDTASNLKTVTDPLGNVTTYRYDEVHQLVEITEPDPDGAGSLTSPVTTFAYDDSGLLTSMTDALGRVTSYEYDDLGRLVKTTLPDPDGAGSQIAPIYQTAYDKANNVVTETDALGNVTAYAYDARNRLVKMTEADPDGAGSLAAPEWEYAYDDASQLTSATDPLNRVTTYDYDDLGRMIEELSPDPDGAGAGLAPRMQYTFDAVGNMLTATDRLGNATSYGYDSLYRQTSQTNANDETTSFTFDVVGNMLSLTDPEGNATIWAYDAASQLTEAGDSFASYTYSRDNLGRVTTIANTLAGLTPTVTFAQAFDANSRRTQLSATIGSTADFQNDYTFDNLNRLTQITQQDVGGGNTVADKRVDFAYLADGQFDTIKRYADLTGTQLVAQSNYGYDGAGRVTSLDHIKGSTTFAGYGWAFDAANRITAFTNSQHSTEDATYSYDDASQLTGADRTGTTNDEAYTFDENGNRETANGATYTTTANNRLASDGTYNYEYDAEGNRTKQTNIATGYYRTFNWDHRNRLVAVINFDNLDNELQRVEYAYDAFDRLIVREVDTDGDTPTSTNRSISSLMVSM